MSTTEHLISFAKDQLRVIKGWQGRNYVRRCLAVWELEYGKPTADLVRAALNAEKES